MVTSLTRSGRLLLVFPCVYVLLLVAACQAFGQQAKSKRQAPSTKSASNKGVRVERTTSDRWAVLVGVNDYAEIASLRYCAMDMEALRDQLISGGFKSDHVFLLTDSAKQTKYRPLKANVERQLSLVLDVAGADDLVVVGFSGHGVCLDGISYLCPNEARLDDTVATLISLDDVYKRLSKCRAALKLMLVDACRNDPRTKGQKSFMSSAQSKAFALQLEKPPRGVLLLTSCNPGEVSMEEEKFRHGVFMHFVLEALRGNGDLDHNSRVSLVELYKYANRETKAYVAGHFNKTQVPSLKGELADDFNIAVANSSSPPRSSSQQNPVQVRIVGPEGMRVYVADSNGKFSEPRSRKAPTKMNLSAGREYRLKLTEIPGREGVMLYPLLTISPMSSKTAKFFRKSAVTVEFTEAEFDRILSGESLTKAIYDPAPEFVEMVIAGVETPTTPFMSNFMLYPGEDPNFDPVSDAKRRGCLLVVLEVGNLDLSGR